MTGGAKGRRSGVAPGARRAADPFSVLGVPARADLTNAEIRSAWRRIAAATHPDRADGGDPERFAAAAAAYTELRTPSGRGEARAALADRAGRHRAGRHRVRRSGLAGLPLRVRDGRPARLAVRVVGSVVVGAIAVLAAGHGPAGPALATGTLTWLIVSARADLG